MILYDPRGRPIDLGYLAMRDQVQAAADLRKLIIERFAVKAQAR